MSQRPAATISCPRKLRLLYGICTSVQWKLIGRYLGHGTTIATAVTEKKHPRRAAERRRVLTSVSHPFFMCSTL